MPCHPVPVECSYKGEYALHSRKQIQHSLYRPQVGLGKLYGDLLRGGMNSGMQLKDHTCEATIQA